MDLANLRKNWDTFGKTDPLWSILTDPAKKGGKWNLQEFLQTGELEIAETFERLKSLKLSVASRRALDFGCGVGRLTQALSSRFDECWGVDIAHSMIALAEEVNAHPDRCHYIVNETNDLTVFPSGHFDFIYSRLVLQHMRPIYAKSYIKEFLRILAPEGVLVFQMPEKFIPPPIKPGGRRSPPTGALPADAFRADIVCTSATTTLEAGSSVALQVAVTNRSNTTWPSIGQENGRYCVRLGNHWLDAESNRALVHDDARANLQADLEPGKTAEFVLTVNAPAWPGDYNLELDMVQEAVAWFAECGSKTARLRMRVVEKARELQTQVTPVMELYSIPKQELTQLISGNGGEIVDIIADDCAGPGWLSSSYCVKKQTITSPGNQTHPVRSSSRTDAPFCSIIVVNFNGSYLDACLCSLEAMDYPAERFEILLVDNGSDDGSDNTARLHHPAVRILHNSTNNFAGALNLGVKSSQGDYVAFCNNDVFVGSEWLKQLVRALEEHPSAGCASGKILFEDGRINSVGHRELPDFYWEDEGYGEEDVGQHEEARQVEGVCWAAVLFRRVCLQDLGQIDEDYVMYYEDVDTSTRCRQRGWAILYEPRAVTQHVFHGSSGDPSFAEFFCDRSRLIYVAKHHPDRLAEAIRTSRFLIRGESEALYDTLPVTLKKLIQSHASSVVKKVLDEVSEALVRLFGALAVDNLFARMQVILGHRKTSVAFYDQAAHLIGGGQKYGCTMAAALDDRYDVTLISNKPVQIAELEQWYRIPLDRTRIKTIPLQYFEDNRCLIDVNVLPENGSNPFDAISDVSQQFDLFVNVNMLATVEARSPFSIFLCHFPDVAHSVNFSADQYTCLVVNSRYTSVWARARWGIEPTMVLYPPVDMIAEPSPKERIILAAARFEHGGSKKQIELIAAFEKLCHQDPELMSQWRLVLVGGSIPDNPYLQKIERRAARSFAPIEVHVNIPLAELQSHYVRARIFWHACGLDESEPGLTEHFGMTTVEAMQNHCIPIVINGGGQREIVEQGLSGYRFNTIDELCERTRQVIASPDLADRLSQAAFQRSRQFHRERFDRFVKRFFSAIEEEYRTIRMPDPRDILSKRRAENLFYSPLARRQFTASSILRSRVPC